MFPRLGTISVGYGELVSGPPLRVPGYQRPYSWSLKEVTQLFDDICAAAGLDEEEMAEDDYFLGTLILLSRPEDAEADDDAGVAGVRDIVDGQQRLLTLTILTAVLRDIGLPDGAAEIAGPMMDWSLATGPDEDPSMRLAVREQDRDFFAGHVQRPGATLVSPLSIEGLPHSQTAILAARDHMAGALAERPAEDHERLFAYLRDRCHFVVIETGDIDKAHRLFSVINDRGMPLQRDQILKAELLRRCPLHRREHLTSLWDRMETALGDSFEDLFAHIRTAHGLARPQIIDSIRLLVDRAGGPEPFVDDVFTPLASAYGRIVAAGAPGAAADPRAAPPLPVGMALTLRKLGRLSGEDWVPAAMLVLDRFGDDPDRAGALLDEIDRLAHALRLLCLGSKRRQSRFAKVCAALRNDPGGVSEEHPAFALARDEVRAIQHHLKDLYTRSLQASKLVLLRLNDEWDDDPRALALQPGDVSVEHVLPQRPKAQSDWRRAFPDPEERAACTASLGNLVLVTQKQNERARNEEFVVKKRVYVEDTDGLPPTAITREVLIAPRWDAEAVRTREARMLAALSRILRIELTKGHAAGQRTGRAASA